MASNEQFYNRMREIAGIKSVNESKTETNTKTLIDTERSNNGTVYGIVKENHHYYIKKALVKEGDVKVTDFIYIDGVENKRNYQYNSLAEAEKQRNFYVKGINEAFDQGGVYFMNENHNNESPSLDVNEDFSSLVRRTINEGKKNISENREKKFKSDLPVERSEPKVRRGLMPESADVAVKKALGLLKEEAPFTEKAKTSGAEVTADSEIKDSDILADKKGKESPQAPINDSNAKAKAEKATATGKKDANKKPESGKSIAVNQADKALKEEASPLVTDDSEIIASDSVADKVSQKHEAPQAPINDGNAKAMADKAMGKSSSSEAISNNVDDSPESDPFDDKENAGDETGDIVTEDTDKGDPFDNKAKLNSSGDIVAADSDEVDADRVDDETKHETPDAEYNNYNQPEKGQKEHKGEPSVQKDSDPFDDKTKAGQEKGDIVAEQAALALGSLLSEGDDLSTADSEINADESPANSKSNISYGNPKLEKGTSLKMNDNAIAEGKKEDMDGDGDIDSVDYLAKKDQAIEKAMDKKDVNEAAEDEIADAAAAIGDVEAATDAEETAPEIGGEAPADAEVNIDTPEGGEVDVDVDGAPDGGDDGADSDLVSKEIEKLVGKLGQKIRTATLEPETAEGHLKSIVSAFKDKLPEMDLDTREEVAKEIKEPEEGGGEVDVDVDVEAPAEEPAPEMGGEVPADAEVGGGEFAAMGEDAPMTVNGEDVIDGEIPDTFEAYMESRGYSADNLGECSASEMGSIVSGYISDKDELDEAEIENIAGYMNGDVATELEEYGHGDFAAKASPFMKEDGISFGMTEPTLPDFEMDSDAEAQAMADMAADGEIAEDDDEEVGGDIEGEIEDELADDAEEEMTSVVSVGEPADEPEEEEAEEIGFANAADIMGGGVVKPEGAKTKSVEVDLNAGTLKMDVSESNVKVREYIQNRLQELAGKKKPSMNESSKSDNLKKLDKLIEQQWKLAGDKLLKK